MESSGLNLMSPMVKDVRKMKVKNCPCAFWQKQLSEKRRAGVLGRVQVAMAEKGNSCFTRRVRRETGVVSKI